MKKQGISLIVLVITILVMIILAGAIIITLSNQNIIGKARWAEVSSNRSNLQNAIIIQRADYMASNDGSSVGFTADTSDFPTGFTMSSDGVTVIYTGDAVDGAPTATADIPSWYTPDT